jgi:hypothetical protein
VIDVVIANELATQVPKGSDWPPEAPPDPVTVTMPLTAKIQSVHRVGACSSPTSVTLKMARGVTMEVARCGDASRHLKCPVSSNSEALQGLR